MPVDRELYRTYVEAQFSLLRSSLDFYIAVETDKPTLYTRSRKSLVRILAVVLVAINAAVLVLSHQFVPAPYSGIVFIACAGASFLLLCSFDSHIRKQVKRFIEVLHSLGDYSSLIGSEDPIVALRSRDRVTTYQNLLAASSERDWELPFYFYDLLR